MALFHRCFLDREPAEKALPCGERADRRAARPADRAVIADAACSATYRRQAVMSLVQSIRLSIRAKVLLLALGLALPPLLIVSMLGLSSLNAARDAAMQTSIGALRQQAEENLAKRAADK